MDAIANALAESSPRAAERFTQRIEQSLTHLAAFPRAGRQVPEFQDESLRELIIQSYRLVYRVTTKEIEVVTIRHGARLLGDREIEN